ncbi:MAG: hypothetical protein J7K09_01365 [Desulfuromusa sp.]|nr:hypothetical protein [Desulfuromusa sp.]
MKKLLLTILAITLTTPGLTYAKSFGPEYDKIVTFFQGQTEPEALDAIWESKTVFKVGVMDDGKSRDRYANYVCEILYNESFRGQGVEVKIIDIEKLAYKNKWVTLGKARCE